MNDIATTLFYREVLLRACVTRIDLPKPTAAVCNPLLSLAIAEIFRGGGAGSGAEFFTVKVTV
jgi:hypothetical protein